MTEPGAERGEMSDRKRPLDDIYGTIRTWPLDKRITDVMCILRDTWGRYNREPRRSIPPQPYDEDLIVWATLEEIDERLQKAEAEAERLRAALRELLATKRMKDEQGKTPEYERRREAAWRAAKAALEGGEDD